MARQYDGYGNYTDDDGATWVGVGPNAGQFYYGGTWHDFPPIGSASSSSGITYGPRQTDTDGSVTGTPGATYQMGSNGLPASIVRPSTGGGGSSSPTTVYINQNPGELYQTIVSDGTDGYPAGTVYQVNQLTGAVTVKSRPSTSEPASLWNDRNGDGYDDQTGLPNGVVRDSKSPSGYLYQGKPVNADGSLYTGSSAGGSDLDLSNKITLNGQVYVWSNKDNKYVLAPGLPVTSGPGSTPSSGGTYSASGSATSRTILSSGGGSSSGSDRDYAAEDAASDARTAAMQEAQRKWQTAENDKDRAQAAAQFQATYGLSVQQFAEQQRQAQAKERQQAITDFRSAVNDTDPNAVRAWLYGNGAQQGGNILNRISEGGDALSPNALAGAAALLGTLRGTPAASLGSWLADYPGLANIAATGLSGATGEVLPAGSPLPPGTQDVTGTTTTTPGKTNPVTGQVGSGPIPPYITGADGKQVLNPAYVVEQGKLRQQEAAQAEWAKRTGWYPVSGPAGIVYTEYANGVPTGKQMSQAEFGQFQQNNDPQSFLSKFYEGASVSGGYGGALSGGLVIKPKTYDELGQASGTDSQTLIPWAAGYQLPGLKPAGEMPYGNDNIQRGIDLPNKTVIPGLARGGVAYGTMLVGENGPEIVHAPGGAKVVPISRMMMRGLQRGGMPGYAAGTGDSFAPVAAAPFARSTPWYMRRGLSTAQAQQPAPVPAITPATTAGSGAATPAPVATPVTSSPSVGSSPPPAPVVGSTPAPAATPATPAPQPVTVSGLSGNYDVSTLTPEQQALMDEIANWRRTATVPDIGSSPYDVAFGALAPSVQQAYLKSIQTRYGVPTEDLAWEINRNQAMMPGLSRGTVAVGY